MNTKIFLVLVTLFGLCFAEPLIGRPKIDDGASVDTDVLVVYDSVGFEDHELFYAVELAKSAQLKHKNKLGAMMNTLRDLYDGKFPGAKWNCMAGELDRDDNSGWRDDRYIKLYSTKGDDQMIICSQGCNTGVCFKFGDDV